MEKSNDNMGAPVQQFAIFHFGQDNSVAVVPTLWLSDENTGCWYPNADAKLKLKTSVKKMIPVTTGFTNYTGRVLGLFGNFFTPK